MSDDLWEIMRTARAIRRYRDEPVSDDVLRECLEAATWAPSGSNRQAWKFVVLRSPEARAVLGPAYRTGWAEMSGGYDLGDPTEDTRRGRMARTMRHFVDTFENVPAYVLFCVAGRDRAAQLADGASIYPAVQNFILAARARGLGTVMTTWFQFCERELREIVGIPDDWIIAALLPVGYPAGSHGPVRRRPISEVASVDRWDQPL